MELSELCLKENPFPQSGTGLTLKTNEKGYFSEKLEEKLDDDIRKLMTSEGREKILPVIGEYGTGKTSFITNLVKEKFIDRDYKVFYFQNPGVQLYDLANSLLREVGRVEFAKSLFELVSVGMLKDTIFQFVQDFSEDDQKATLNFSSWIESANTKEKRRDKIKRLQDGILKSDLKITQDEEIAYKLATMILDTRDRAYFDYRDFVTTGKGSYVAEREEPKYFTALIKILKEIYNVRGIVFIIDEFEDVVAQSRMPLFKQTYYLQTLKHLYDLSKSEDFVLVLAMTPQSLEPLKQNDEALYQRLSPDSPYAIKLEEINSDEINKTIEFYVNERGRSDDCKSKSKLFPFPENIGEIILNERSGVTLRQIIKLSHFLVARAATEENVTLPFEEPFILDTLKLVFPGDEKYE
jgi:GTPase SAR1 family protein